MKENLASKLLDKIPEIKGEDSYPIQAYSEYMPPPRIGWTPYSGASDFLKSDKWIISELESELEINPGLRHSGEQIFKHVLNLARGKNDWHILGHGEKNIKGNPYWSHELINLPHEKYLIFLPLMISRTQDDKGRVRWTFFGGGVKAPEYDFWKSFGSGISSFEFIKAILNMVYSENIVDECSLKAAGFGVLHDETCGIDADKWAEPFQIDSLGSQIDDLKYLLTFKAFKELPEKIRSRYLDGKLALLPFPGSLVFYGMPSYKKLADELPMGMQIPLQRLVARKCAPGGFRVPQSGWFHEDHPDIDVNEIRKELLEAHYHRTHRFNKVHRHDDELASAQKLNKLINVLFSSEIGSLGLYDKPMARNCQIWDHNYSLLLNGPQADSHSLKKAEKQILGGGLFGYRFFFPPMKTGLYDIYMTIPFAAFLKNENPEFLNGPEGYFSAYVNGQEVQQFRAEFQKRSEMLSALRDFNSQHDHFRHQTALNLYNLLDISRKINIPEATARAIIRVQKGESLSEWEKSLLIRASSPDKAESLISLLNKQLKKEAAPCPAPLTFQYTASRKFELDWWNDIKFLAHGRYVNKDNADCAQDEKTISSVIHYRRDLEHLGDYLIDRHQQTIDEHGMHGEALCGSLPFRWKTDFPFPGFGGWKKSQNGEEAERNILVIIPGRRHDEAVVMGDHYDTAYMEDVYDTSRGGNGARLSANGADDNHSATATLLQALPIFLKLSKAGMLERDVWLLHLTGEEFPSDCMGARNFCQALIEKRLKLKVSDGSEKDISSTRIKAVYVMDMIAHNKDSNGDVFQISPGTGDEAFEAAREAHHANLIWNSYAHEWNKAEDRKHAGRGKRVKSNDETPVTALHPQLEGEIRLHHDPHSSLYNTDGQIFSDSGIPVVLIMENYDLNRCGYHDTKDTMENIDLDYGSAVAATAIEAAARMAVLK